MAMTPVAKPLTEPMLENCQLDAGIKLQWNFNRNSNISVQEKAFENVVYKMAPILSLPQCVYKQNICEMYYTPVKASPGVSLSPIEGLWGSQKYPGQPDTSATIICWNQAHWNQHLSVYHTEQSEQWEQREQETHGGLWAPCLLYSTTFFNKATKGCRRQLSLSRYAYICIFIHTYKHT